MATDPATDAAVERLVRYALRRRGVRCGPGRHGGALISRSAVGRDALYELLNAMHGAPSARAPLAVAAVL